MGAMGAIASTAKKLWGRRPQVAPTEILSCQPENAPKALAAGLRPDPLGELKALPQRLDWIGLSRV